MNVLLSVVSISISLKSGLYMGVWLQSLLPVIASALLCGVIGYITSGKHSNVRIKFGVMELDEFGEYYVSTETTHIPLYPIERHSDFRFGYTLEYADNRVFSSYFVLSLPKPPRVIQGGLREAMRSDDNRVLTSFPAFYQQEAIETFAFNESDPLGNWKVEIYVNDELLQSIRFMVVHPDKVRKRG